MRLLTIAFIVCLFAVCHVSSNSSSSHKKHHKHHHHHKKSAIKPAAAPCCKDCDRKCAPTQPCGENEDYIACPPYCTYDPTCDAAFFSGRVFNCFPPTAPNTWACSPRCACKPGYVRKNGKCVTRECCCDDPNSELVSCRSPCNIGCNGQPIFCNQDCIGRVCRCRNGFVQNAAGKCIPQSECPNPGITCTGANQVANGCFAPAGCLPEDTCATLLGSTSLGTTTTTIPRCECAYGYVKDGTGACVSVDTCCAAPFKPIWCSDPLACRRSCGPTAIYCPPFACGVAGTRFRCGCLGGLFVNTAATACVPSC